MDLTQLSKRAQDLLIDPPPMVKNSIKARANMYDPETNPNGFIDLTTAQNSTVWREIKDRLTQEAEHVPESAFHYDQFTGVAPFRKALAESIFGRTAFKAQVDPDDLVVFTGSGAILDTLAVALTEPGDEILIPAPYYGGFDLDFQLRPKAHNVTFPMRGFAGNELVVDDIKATLESREKKPRILVITNPMNPQGTVMDRDTLQQCVDFAKEHQLEIIFDEIYANSVWGDAEFISALHLDVSGWEEHVHVVYGFSKDFGLDGFRIGILHTKSAAVKAVCNSVAYFTSVSGYVQHVLGRAIADADWTEHILTICKDRLRTAHDQLLNRLQSVRVPQGRTQPFSASNACIFGWFYLGAFLTEETQEAEMELLNAIIAERVVVGAGSFYGSTRPGWFRISLAAHSDDVLEEAHERIVKVLEKQVEKIESQN